jgi:hypothetical protein
MATVDAVSAEAYVLPAWSSPPSAQKRENRLAVNSLMLASAARNFAITVRQQSEQEIWLLAYQGDFGAQARAQGLLESVAGTRSGTARSVIMCTPQLTAHAAVWSGTAP